MSYKIDFDIDLDKALMKIPKHDAKLLKENPYLWLFARPILLTKIAKVA